MPEFDVEVVGRKRRKPQAAAVRRSVAAGSGGLVRAVLKRPRLLVFGGLMAFLLFMGTPHIAWNYRCMGSQNQGGGCRSYDYCEYYGFQGRWIIYPGPGETCRLFRFIRIDWNRLSGAPAGG